MKRNIFCSLVLFGFLLIGCQAIFAQTDTLYGRVTDESGKGIPRVRITIYESGNFPFCPDGKTITALTNPFGYYSAVIDYYCTGIITPSAKNYTFNPSVRIIFFGTEDYSNVTFVGTHD